MSTRRAHLSGVRCVGEVEVRPENEEPVLFDDYDYAIIGIGRQLTDSGVVRTVALYSQSVIINSMVYDSLNFISAHSGELKGSDYEAAYKAAQERFSELLVKWEGPGMPVIVLDMEGEEDDGSVNDGQAQPVEG